MRGDGRHRSVPVITLLYSDLGPEGANAGAPRGWGLVRGAVAPPQFGALPPEKFSNLTCNSMHFHAIFALNSTLNLMTSFT